MTNLFFSNPVQNRFTSTISPEILKKTKMSMKSLFSNNAQVYYKKGTLSSGVGGVNNSKIKSLKT